MARRVVIGKMADGSFDLRCSLPGIDALTVDIDRADRCSFSSHWTDMVVAHQVGNVSVSAQNSRFTWGHAGQGSTRIAFPALSSVPFVEVRGISGSTAYDDRGTSQGNALVFAVTNDEMWCVRRLSVSRCFYVIFKEGSLVA